MALTVGELIGSLNIDERGWSRGLDQAQLQMLNLQRDATGRIRSMSGRFVAESNIIAHALGEVGEAGQETAQEVGQAGQRIVQTQRRVAESTRSTSNVMKKLVGALKSVGNAALSMAPAAASAGVLSLKLGAAISVAAALAGTLANIAPAAGVAITSVFALVSAVGALKVGMSGVGDAISAAFAPASGGGGGGGGGGGPAGGIAAIADAQEQVARAREQAARANEQAAKQVRQSEEELADAQKDALEVQKGLTKAREEATRGLEDMNSQLANARLDERAAIDQLADAENKLATLRAMGSRANVEDLKDAQLAYDQAAQQLKDQQTDTKRLEKDTAAANKAGVEGSDEVTDAKKDIADASDRVKDAEDALAEARKEQAQTAKDGLQSIKDAQDAVGASGAAAAGGGGGLGQFNDALAKLSPNARAFVLALVSLKDEWNAVKMAVQDALFEGLDQVLLNLASSVLPVFGTSLVKSAESLNLMAKGAAAAAIDLAEDGTLGQALGSANKGLQNLVPIPGLVVTALGQIGAAAGPAFESMTQTATTKLEGVAAKMSTAFESGAMQASIERAVDLISQLGTIAGNVLDIVGSIFDAADGGTLLDVLEQLTQTLSETFASPEIQGGLQALFGVVEKLATTAMPLLDSALKVIGPVLEKLGPPVEMLIEELGKGLEPIIDALGPVLETAATAVGSLVKAVAPLLVPLGELITAILPILTPFLETIGTLAAALAPILSEVAGMLADLLAPAFEALAAILGPLLDLLLIPIKAILSPISDLLGALRGPVEKVGEAFGLLDDLLEPLISTIRDGLQATLEHLEPVITPLIDAVGKLSDWVTDRLGVAIETVAKPIIEAFSKMLSGDFSEAWRLAKEAGANALKWITDNFRQFPQKAKDALTELKSKMGQAMSDAMTWFKQKAAEKLGPILLWFKGIPQQIKDKIGSLKDSLISKGEDVVRGLWQGIQSMGPWLMGKLSSWAKDVIPGPIADALGISSPSKLMADEIGHWLPAGVAEGADRNTNVLRRSMQRMAGVVSDQEFSVGAVARSAAGGAGAGGGVFGGQQRLVIEIVGAESEFKTFMRKIVRVDGQGSTQTAFGVAS